MVPWVIPHILMFFVLETCVSERFTSMGWGPENGVFPKTSFFCLRIFWACMRAKPQFRQDFSLIFFKIAKMVFRAVPGLRHFSALRFWGLRYLCACMRAKPQFRQHFILTLLDIRAHVSARSGSDSFFFFFFFVFLSCHFSQPGLVGFGFLSRACARSRSFGTS